MSVWSSKFPTESGHYWFRGCRYGLVSCGQLNEPETMLIEVIVTATGSTMVKAQGQFMYESEIDFGWFMPAEIPKGPSFPSVEIMEEHLENVGLMNDGRFTCVNEYGKIDVDVVKKEIEDTFL